MSDIKSVIRARDELARIVGLREKELREMFERNDKNVKLYLKAEAQLERTCTWGLDSTPDYEVWESACGHSWVFEAGGIEENNVSYCQGCGGKVLQALEDKT